MNFNNLLFFISVLFCTINGSQLYKRKEAGFLFVYSKAITSTLNETVCLSVYDAITPFRISVDLKIREKHFIKRHVIENAHDCFEITVPKLRYRAKDVHYGSFHIQIELNNTIQTAHSQGPILIFENTNKYFVETDRTFYKPGDIVRVRILVLNNQLKPPEHLKIPLVKIINPSGLTVNVWDNISTNSGLVQLEHELPGETTQGKWKIEVDDIIKVFTVKEYDLPRFKVFLENPRKIYSDSQNIRFVVCAKYTYGKNVKGSVFIKISFKYFNRDAITQVKGLTDGCATFDYANDELHLHEQVHSHLTITTVVTEHGTNRAETSMSKSHIVNEAYKIKFSDDILFFHPGFSYKGRLSATNTLIDLRGEVVEICYTLAVNYVWNIQNIKECSNFTFDNGNGIDFSIPPLKDNVIKVDIQAVSLNQTIKEEWPTRVGQSFPDRYSTKVTGSVSISRWYSPSRSYIHLEPMQKTHLQCQSVQEYIVQYSSNLIETGETVYFHYIIKSRSKIFQSGRLIHRSTKHHPVLLTELNNVVGSNHSFVKSNHFMDKFSFKLSLGNEVYSKARLLLYFVLKTAETVASSVDANIERCLPNKVDAKWSEKDFRPGNEAKLTIKTSGDSLCAVSAIDKSSVMLSNSKPLTVASILKPFIEEKESKQTSVLNCVPRHVRKPLAIEKNNNSHPTARRRRSPSRTYFSSQYDSFEAFDVIGVGFITNLNILTKQCEEDPPSPLNSTHSRVNSLETRGYHYNVDDSDEEIFKRSLFPETWLWDLVPLQGNDEIQISRSLPHSITNWVTNVLCVSPTKGVGVSSTSEISVFQPFFLDVLAPRTIKRNEVVHLQTIVFNYLNYSIPLRISLGNTTNVDSVGYPNDRSVTHCVHPNDSKVTIFRITSSYLGQINISISAEVDSSYPGECGPDILLNKRDEVIKSVIVEPEGYTVEKTGSILLCGGDNSLPNNVSWTLTVPNDVIRDSDKATVTIDADLMGPTIRNIEKLINVPSGCGEQLVAAIAPNLYILRYLNATGKLLGPTRQRIIRNLKIGYQRILNYVHEDGSFSAFGYHDVVGSTFLTSFVVRTLVQLKQHIYVDQSIIDKAVEWILMNQLENGCFNAVSHVFHDMGGTSTENSTAALTSYVIISILESGIELKEKVRNDAQFCIRGHHSPDKYTLAISSYALTLIGWQSEATRALRRLLEIATVEDNLMWWSSPESISTNIEMTGYALMTLLHHGGTENLIHAHSVVRWLITQRQSHGGFTTSQDTAVALDAISRYMILVKGKSANLSVHVATNEREVTMPINHRDKLKTKHISVPRLPNLVKVIVNGEGCVLATNVVQYNMEHMMNSEAFKLAVDVESVSSTDKCSIAMVSPCLAYKMPDIKSNMAVLEIKMPTGYEPDRGSLYKLRESNPKVKRFEETENQVVLYFTKLSNDPICVPFTINENAVVDSRVDAIAKLYDYYNPELQTAITYHINSCKPGGIAPLPVDTESVNTTTTKINYLSSDSFPGEKFSRISDDE